MPKTANPNTIDSSGRAPMSTESAAILNETIKKQLRHHHLFEDYMLSPNAIKNIVISQKPTSTLYKEGIDVQEIMKIKSLQGVIKDNWRTEGQVYGEDTTPLVRLTDPRFFHPKTVTEITKKYGTALKTKEK